MIIEGIPSWLGALALVVLYLVAVVNVGLLVEDTLRKARAGELRPIPVGAESRRRRRR